uniref:Uncharacterized protein n=1 Tax=Meloidogyne javanica TaxID=6303 RepID=A0A915MDE8_MELJA
MRVESNYEVDILSRLGILERETPNDIIITKIKSNRFVDKKRKFHRVSLNVALNKISLSESSTDEDKDFINKKLSSETKKDQTIFYSSNNNCHSNPNFCEFISLLSAAGFLGFSLTLKESNFETNFDGINILINSIFILLGSYFEGRQRQIIEYKSSINGKGNTQNSSKTKRKLKKKVKTSKGAYSLLEMNRRIANKNNTEKQQKTLISSNDDRSSFDSEDDEDEADVEMESVTGDYDEELEREECTKINELL